MDTSVDRASAGLPGAKTRHGLTEAKLRELQPGDRAYKVSDGGNGLYVVVSPSGTRSFRHDYRLGGRRETLTIGRHEPVARHAQRSHLSYGVGADRNQRAPAGAGSALFSTASAAAACRRTGTCLWCGVSATGSRAVPSVSQLIGGPTTWRVPSADGCLWP